MTDTWIFISVGLLSIGMAVLGGHVATTNRWCKAAFYIMGTVSACLVIWQGLRTQYSQQESAAEIQSAEQGLKGFVADQERQTRALFEKQPNAHIGNPIFAQSIIEPPKARLQFVFGNPLAEMRKVSLPMNGGKVAIDFSVIVSGSVAAQHGALWVTACGGCKFENLSPGWLPADDTGHVINGGEFSNIYLGVHLPPNLSRL